MAMATDHLVTAELPALLTSPRTGVRIIERAFELPRGRVAHRRPAPRTEAPPRGPRDAQPERPDHRVRDPRPARVAGDAERARLQARRVEGLEQPILAGSDGGLVADRRQAESPEDEIRR